MKILYIFPHPDDESFGPAAAMSHHLRHGHEVYLLTLTRGGATRERFRLGYSVEQMGEIRFREMQEVEQVLALTEMCVLDFPDSGLKDLDPRELEQVIREEIARVQPDVVVTYAVHGVSGLFDHLIAHAVVKRAYVELRDGEDWAPRRLALFTLSEETATNTQSSFKLRSSKVEDIDCVIDATTEDYQAMHRALDCYHTYQDVISASGVRTITGPVYFEIFQEQHQPPLTDLFAELPT